MKHPIQPIENINGILRFKKNAIVDFLTEGRLNELSAMDFPQEDWEQLAQLIGYSLSGFGDLSYVSDETYETATNMQEGNRSEAEARIQYLEETLMEIRNAVKQIVPHLFKIHEDDLIF